MIIYLYIYVHPDNKITPNHASSPELDQECSEMRDFIWGFYDIVVGPINASIP